MICLKRAVIIFLICGVILNTACGREYDREKQNDIEYTIVSEEEMPQEIRQLIQESEKESFRKTYADKDYLYIIVGYGAQPTNSYSTEVEKLYESSNAKYVTTMLKGPSKTEKVLEVETYPVITIKIPYEEKPVVFQ